MTRRILTIPDWTTGAGASVVRFVHFRPLWLLAAAAAIVFAGAFAAPLATPALAQNANLTRELERLRRDLNDLQRYVYKGKAPAGGVPSTGVGTEVVARMQLQITQMQGQIRTMNGQVEEVQHGIDVLNQRFDRMASDLELRFQGIEDAIAAGTGMAAAGSEDGALKPPEKGSGNLGRAALAGYPGGGSPRDQYDYSFSLLKNRDYTGAAAALKLFLEKNPDDALASNALYWLGETRYVQKNYKESAKIFLDGYKRYPKGAKAPDNLLKLGMSLAQLGETGSSCKTYAKLLSTFPKAASKIRDAANRERKKLKCS